MTLSEQWESNPLGGRAQFNKPAVDPQNPDNVYVGGLQDAFKVLTKSDGESSPWSLDRAGKPGLSDCSGYRHKGDVIFGSGQGKLFACNADDGDIKWEDRTGNWSGRSDSAVTARPVVGSDDLVHTATNDGGILTYEYETGNRVWSTDIAGTGDGVYAPLRRDGGLIYATTKEGDLVVLEATDPGDIQWRESFVPFGNSGPALGDGKVYVAGDEVHAYEAASTETPVWSSSGFGGAVGSTPAYSDKTVYVGSEDGNIYSISTADGSINWTYPTDGPVAGGPAVNADGTQIAVVSTDGNLYLLDDSGAEIQTISIAKDSRSTPTFQDGALYFGDRDGIVRKYA